MRNLVRNQPNLAMVNQVQSTKLKHKAQDPCFCLGLCIVKKKKKKKKNPHTIRDLEIGARGCTWIQRDSNLTSLKRLERAI